MAVFKLNYLYVVCSDIVIVCRRVTECACVLNSIYICSV